MTEILRKMVRKTVSASCWLCECGYDDGVAHLHRSRDSRLSEFGQVVLVRSADLLDQTVCSQTFQLTGDLRGRFVRQSPSECSIRQPADVVFAANNRQEQFMVLRSHDVEAAIAAAGIPCRARNLPHFLQPVARVLCQT